MGAYVVYGVLAFEVAERYDVHPSTKQPYKAGT